ncbi:MAG TPA: DUF3857 domain-containing protein [Candidatus Polarisedimenticolia bacterium]|nr:DUF3857 domain-containing protein [Candidatus Polarisedimenticolia bacterium]
MSLRARRWHATVLLGAAWLLSGAPAQAKLPDWAEAIAASAPELPEGVPEHHGRVLLTEERCRILQGGTVQTRRRMAVQAQRPFAQWQVGTDSQWFGATGKVTSARAWHLPPGGRGRRNWDPPIDVAVGDSFLHDSMQRMVRVGGVRKGSLIFYEFEATDTPYFMNLHHIFFEGHPIDLGRFELEAPADWTIRGGWLRVQGPEPVVSGQTRVWELKDIPFPRAEPMAPPGHETAPVLVIQAVPGEGVASTPATFADWKAVSGWYEELVKDRHAVTPAIRTAANEAFEQSEATVPARILAAGRYVRDRIRYIAIELGIGGWQPHHAAVTLERLYGDCKDKATLFRALLATEGIPSYPVLINLARRDAVHEELPVPAFNHAIAAIPIGPDVEVPLSMEGALVDGGELGRLLMVDTTDESTSIGSLSDGIVGQHALVVAGGKGRLVRLPDSAETHRLERRIRVEVHADRSQTIARASRYLGAYAARARADHAESAAERKELVHARIDALWTGAELKDYGAEPEADDGSFMETATLTLTPPPGVEDGLRVRLFPGAEQDLPRVPLRRRTAPVLYGHALRIRYETTLRHVPESLPLPEPREHEGDGWLVTTSYDRKGDAITARWDLRLSKPRFVPGEFDELQHLWSAVASTANEALTLPPPEAAAPAGP